MKSTLGSFEGHAIDVGAFKLSGSASERVGSMSLGEEVYVVARTVVSTISHGETKDGYMRLHKAEVVNLAIIEEADGKRMLAEGQALADRRFGIKGLFSRSLTLRADENGELIPDDEEADG